MTTKLTKKLSLLFILSAIMFASCGTPSKDQWRISGTIKNGEDKQLYLMEMTTQGFLPLDTIALSKKGKFSIKKQMKDPSIYVLMASENDYITLVPQGGDDIKMDANFNSLSSTYSINGSKNCQMLHDLNEEYIQTNTMLASLQQTLHDNIYASNVQQVKAQLLDKYNVLELHQKAYIKKMLQQNKGSLVCIIALYRTFDNHFLFSLKNPEDLQVYKDVYVGLSKTMPTNQHTIGLGNLIRNAQADMQKSATTQPIANK
jgi:hypothetical protein